MRLRFRKSAALESSSQTASEKRGARFGLSVSALVKNLASGICGSVAYVNNL
ncbi:MAG: hypothetical protein LH614_01130 [Pyrinomonadaceae bacterium]|nr:hypothetical protein [Pyrinomonadaceae bacterium]